MLCVVAGVCCSTSRVQASCGEYLYRNGKPVHQSGTANMAESVRLPMDGLVRVNEPTPIVPLPCHGPNCSQSRLPLAPAPAAPVNLLRHLDPAAILDALVALQGSPEGHVFPESDRGEHFENAAVFRPPAA